MGEKTITQLTELTSASATDILPIVDDVAGSPVTKKIAVSNLVTDTNLTLTDITTGNSSTTKHGFLPKLPNLDHQFLDGTGAWVNLQGTDGWYKDTDTWEYVSATSFRIVGKNVAIRFLKGTKIVLVQTSGKYFYVLYATYTGGNTVVTVTGGSNYSIANATITAAYYSYAENPQGFPQWFNWTPTLTGYSSNPTDTVYRFCISGGKVYVSIREVTNGTSNGAGISITLPVTAATISNQIWMYPAAFVNAGTVSTTWGRGVIGSADNKVVFGINPAVQDGFTLSGGKRISSFEGWYEF